MGVIIYSFNLNISPKMSYGVLECYIVYVTELHTYDFAIKDFVIKQKVLFVLDPVYILRKLVATRPSSLLNSIFVCTEKLCGLGTGLQLASK